MVAESCNMGKFFLYSGGIINKFAGKLVNKDIEKSSRDIFANSKLIIVHMSTQPLKIKNILINTQMP